MLHTHIFELYRIHEVVQGNVRVAAAQARQKRRHQSGKRHQGIAAKGAEQQIKPDDIRLEAPQRAKQPIRTRGIVERPAAHNVKTFWLGMIRGKIIA